MLNGPYIFICRLFLAIIFFIISTKTQAQVVGYSYFKDGESKPGDVTVEVFVFNSGHETNFYVDFSLAEAYSCGDRTSVRSNPEKSEFTRTYGRLENYSWGHRQITFSTGTERKSGCAFNIPVEYFDDDRLRRESGMASMDGVDFVRFPENWKGFLDDTLLAGANIKLAYPLLEVPGGHTRNTTLGLMIANTGDEDLSFSFRDTVLECKKEIMEAFKLGNNNIVVPGRAAGYVDFIVARGKKDANDCSLNFNISASRSGVVLFERSMKIDKVLKGRKVALGRTSRELIKN